MHFAYEGVHSQIDLDNVLLNKANYDIYFTDCLKTLKCH